MYLSDLTGKLLPKHTRTQPFPGASKHLLADGQYLLLAYTFGGSNKQVMVLSSVRLETAKKLETALLGVAGVDFDDLSGIHGDTVHVTYYTRCEDCSGQAASVVKRIAGVLCRSGA